MDSAHHCRSNATETALVLAIDDPRKRGVMGISFANNIRPLFRDKDVASMTRARKFDMSSYAVVSQRADEILQRLQDGDMPWDGPWTADKVLLFQQWIADGRQP